MSRLGSRTPVSFAAACNLACTKFSGSIWKQQDSESFVLSGENLLFSREFFCLLTKMILSNDYET